MRFFLLLAFATSVAAWTSQPATRQGFLQSAAAGAAATFLVAAPAQATETLANGVTYEIKEKGTGPKPDIGELAAIRFAAYYKDVKIDDIFDTPEPYYTRIGSGGLLKGVEAVLPLMQVGDRFVLTIPVSFGPKEASLDTGIVVTFYAVGSTNNVCATLTLLRFVMN